MPVHGEPAVKDVIEAAGVPHPEVDVILVNGQPVTFAYRVHPGDEIAAYPVDAAGGDTAHPGQHLQPPITSEPRFVLDTHLGRLAAYLRLLGLDAAYDNHRTDEELADCASREDRILLTRDVGLLKRGAIRQGHFVRATHPAQQLHEVVLRYDLTRFLRPFTRCLRCNTPLAPVAASAVADRLPPAVRTRQHEFWRCPACERVYWRGSHYQRMLALVERLHAEDSAPDLPVAGA
jgi:uncharacterized protein with PIN domain